jgi:hypothetical protein
MALTKFAVFCSMLLLAVGAADISRGSAGADEICQDMPGDAVVRLPEPLRKWGQIACTAHGQTLGSRDGWIWASLKDASQVAILAGSPEDRESLGEEPYFTEVAVDEVPEDQLARALAVFRHGMELTGVHSKAYVVELTAASGAVARIMFFDFGTFAGGMWCPDEGCVPDSQFLIMKRQSKDQITAAVEPPPQPMKSASA